MSTSFKGHLFVSSDFVVTGKVKVGKKQGLFYIYCILLDRYLEKYYGISISFSGGTSPPKPQTTAGTDRTYFAFNCISLENLKLDCFIPFSSWWFVWNSLGWQLKEICWTSGAAS